jgi:hypothetical protein
MGQLGRPDQASKQHFLPLPQKPHLKSYFHDSDGNMIENIEAIANLNLRSV